MRTDCEVINVEITPVMIMSSIKYHTGDEPLRSTKGTCCIQLSIEIDTLMVPLVVLNQFVGVATKVPVP